MFQFAVLLSLIAYAAALGDPACGEPAIPPSTVSATIVGGYEANRNSWPWQVQVRKISFGGQWCGGTLIDSQWVLSAAHCFHTAIGDPDLSDYEFVLGAHHVNDYYGSYYQKFSASKIILHEGYGSLSNSNDVALIKLREPVDWCKGVSPACLAQTRPSAGTVAWVTGWGDQEASYDPYLQQVDVPIVSERNCKNAYWGIDDTMMCAGYSKGGYDSCQGDSGGPLVYQKSDGTWYLAGVVSWGDGCADAGKYGVYADVAYFYDWITSTKRWN